MKHCHWVSNGQFVVEQSLSISVAITLLINWFNWFRDHHSYPGTLIQEREGGTPGNDI